MTPEENSHFDGIVLTLRTENYKSKYEKVELDVKHAFAEFALRIIVSNKQSI
jgi:hypothetical protein